MSKKYPDFDFNLISSKSSIFEESKASIIMNHCGTIESLTEKVSFLDKVMKKYNEHFKRKTVPKNYLLEEPETFPFIIRDEINALEEIQEYEKTKKYPLFHFNDKRIIDFCATLDSTKEKIAYLLHVREEYGKRVDKAPKKFYDVSGRFYFTNILYNINKELDSLSKKLKLEESIESKTAEPKQRIVEIPIKRLTWLGTNEQLAYLFDELEAKYWLLRDTDYRDAFFDTIAKMFKKHNGTHFKSSDLRAARQNMQKDPSGKPRTGSDKIIIKPRIELPKPIE